jgi:hypothetical protein
MSDNDWYEILDSYDWVVEPPLQILYAIMATKDANAGLNEECD